MSIYLSAEALEYLDALAVHQTRSRSNVLERLIRRVPAPTDDFAGAQRARELRARLDAPTGPDA